MPQQPSAVWSQTTTTTTTSPAPSVSSAAVRWILIESCPDVQRHPERMTPESNGSTQEDREAVLRLLQAFERPFLHGGGGVANMIGPAGPHAGAIVEVRAVRGQAGGPVDGYATPQIIGWGGVDDVDTILRRNARLLRDIAFPEGPAANVSCEYYYATRL